MSDRARVLAAVDLREPSRSVLAQSARICRIRDWRLHAIHVVEPRLVLRLARARGRPTRQLEGAILARAGLVLERLAGEAGVPADTRLRLALGEPTREILAEVDRLGPVLLVLGETGLAAPAFRAGPLPGGRIDGAATRVLILGPEPPPPDL
jgi:hypothetical protein